MSVRISRYGFADHISVENEGAVAGIVPIKDRAGTQYYLWVEAGKLRIHTTAPTDAGSHADGEAVGDQTDS